MRKLKLAFIAVSILSICAVSFAQEDETTTTTTTVTKKTKRKAKKPVPTEETAVPEPVSQKTISHKSAATRDDSLNGSQFFWQASPGRNYLTPQMVYISSNAVGKVGGSIKTTGPSLGIEYEYGVNDTIAIGANEGYTSLKLKDNTGASIDRKGLNDLTVYLKGSTPFSGGNLFKFGTELSYSLGDSETESNGDENEYSGRAKLTPYLGFETNFGNLTAGAKVSYDLALTDISNKTPAGTTKSSGDEDLTAEVFLEGKYSSGKIGGEISYTTTSDTKDKETGVTAKNSSITAFAAYSTYDVSPDATLLGQLIYAKAGSAGNVDHIDSWVVQVGARFGL